MSKHETMTQETTKKKMAPPTVKTEIVKTETKALDTARNGGLPGWGQAEEVGIEDFVIPKILAMQAMSKAVTAGEARFGEFRDSMNKTVLGDVNTPVEFIPIAGEKVWIIFKEEKGVFKYSETIPVTKQNAGWKTEGVTKEGQPIKRYATYNFYVLLTKDLGTGMARPYLLSFRSTSVVTGKNLWVNLFSRNRNAGLSPGAHILQLIGKKTTNDKGTFIVMEVKETRRSSKAEEAEAEAWYYRIKAEGAAIDNSDLEAEVVVSQYAEPESSEY